jgi:arylsulfatase A-like enzyme
MKYVFKILIVILIFSCKTKNTGVKNVIVNNPPKNLLFIITDQQRYDALSYAGNTVLKTPNLDRLAKQGAYFKNAYTPVAVCGPARSSILTGTTINTNGVTANNKTYNCDDEAVMTMKTFDEILTEKGYHAEYYGKWHSLTSHAAVYKNQNKYAKNGKYMFEHGGQSYMYQDYLNAVYPKRAPKKGELLDNFTKRPYTPDPLDVNYGKTYAEVKNENKKFSQPSFHGKSSIPKEHTITAFYAKKTIEAIERLKNKPFSITTSFHFPHAPMIPSEPYYGLYPEKDMKVPESIDDDMANSPYINANGRNKLTVFADEKKIKYMISNYYGLITELDHWMGEIMNKLDETGLAENTLVIFTSDHGEMLGAHGMREKNVFYEESSHVPLLIRLPNDIKKNTKVDGYVSNVDLFATIMDYLQVGTYKSDGESLRDLIEHTQTNHGNYVVTEWNYRGPTSPNYMVVKDGWKLMVPYTEDSKVINAMYHLTKDPHEMNNLLGKNPDREKYTQKAEELRANLLEWLKKNNSKHYDGVSKRKLI